MTMQMKIEVLPLYSDGKTWIDVTDRIAVLNTNSMALEYLKHPSYTIKCVVVAGGSNTGFVPPGDSK